MGNMCQSDTTVQSSPSPQQNITEEVKKAPLDSAPQKSQQEKYSSEEEEEEVQQQQIASDLKHLSQVKAQQNAPIEKNKEEEEDPFFFLMQDEEKKEKEIKAKKIENAMKKAQTLEKK